MKKIIILFITLFAASLFAESEGEKLFKTNNPSGAAVLLEPEKLLPIHSTCLDLRISSWATITNPSMLLNAE